MRDNRFEKIVGIVMGGVLVLTLLSAFLSGGNAANVILKQGEIGIREGVGIVESAVLLKGMEAQANVRVVRQFGKQSNAGTTEQTVWNGSGAYTQDASTTFNLYVSSDNASDLMDFEVSGLDEDWIEQTVTKTLTGQTVAQFGAPVQLVVNPNFTGTPNSSGWTNSSYANISSGVGVYTSSAYIKQALTTDLVSGSEYRLVLDLDSITTGNFIASVVDAYGVNQYLGNPNTSAAAGITGTFTATVNGPATVTLTCTPTSVTAVPDPNAERVANGSFSSDVSWTKGTSATITGGAGKMQSIGTLSQALATVAGHSYLIGSDVTALTTGSVAITVGSDYSVNRTDTYTGWHDIFTATAANTITFTPTPTSVTATVTPLSEKVTNGAFLTDTAWTKTGGWSINSTVASANLSGDLSQILTVVPGQNYRVAYDIIAITTGTAQMVVIRSDNTTAFSGATLSATGTDSAGIWGPGAGITTATIKIIADASATTMALSIDNVECVDISNYMLCTIDNVTVVDISDYMAAVIDDVYLYEETDAQWRRVFSLKNAGAVNNTGTIYAQTAAAVTGGVPDDLTKVRCKVEPLKNAGAGAFYTVPLNKVGLLRGWDATCDGQTDFALKIRENGGVYLTVDEVELLADTPVKINYLEQGYVYRLPELTDVRLDATAAAATATLRGALYIDLAPE